MTINGNASSDSAVIAASIAQASLMAPTRPARSTSGRTVSIRAASIVRVAAVATVSGGMPTSGDTETSPRFRRWPISSARIGARP